MGSLTLPQGAALSIGAVLGTGVIALPALAAETAGPASLVAWLLLIALSVPLAATFAGLGARYPDSGGVATYVRAAFGARAATIVGWSFYFAVPAGAPAAAMFCGAYVESALGGGMSTVFATSALLIATVTAMNAGGVRVSGRLQLGFALLLAAFLVTATLTALPHAQLSNLRPFAPNGWLSIGPAASILIWGFVGWEAVTSLAADYRRPARDLPRATALALIVIGVLYFGLAATSILVLGAASGATDAPLAELLAIGVGGEARMIAAVVAVLLTLGVMNAYFAGAAKLGAALGRDGGLPAWFAQGSESGEVPRRSLMFVSILAGAGLALVAATGLGTRASVLLTTGSLVLVYVFGMAAALRLLPRGSWSHHAAKVAFAAVVALLIMTGVYVLWAGVVVLGAIAYDSRRRRQHRNPQPVPIECRNDRPAIRSTA